MSLDRVWKIIDDNEKTGKYHQIKAKLIDKDNGVCINGLIMAYEAGLKPSDMKVYDKQNHLGNMFEQNITPKFKLKINRENEYTRINESSESEIVAEMKQQIKKGEKLDNVYLARLNNLGWTFTQLRDLLKELDV